MRKTIALTFFVGFLAFPFSVRAEAGWSEYSSIVELTADTVQQRFLLELKSPNSPSGCRNEKVFYQDYATKGVDQMYRMLLEAVAADKAVKVFVSGGCELKGYSEIISVSIRP